MQMRQLLEPQSIAVIGASRDEHSVGHGLLKNLIFGGYQGIVFPINPKARSVLGIKTYSTVLEVEDPIDLAVIIVPYVFVNRVLEECGKKGIPYVIVITSGYKEVGGDGVQREKELIEIAKRNGIRVVGPNCFGIVNTDSRVSMNTTFSRYPFQRGNVALISQSGALAAAVLDYAREKQIGFSKIITLGNKADLDEVDFLHFLKEDPLTKVLLLYLEDISRGREFLKVAKEITRLGKPIIAIKSGRTEAGKEAVSSHTGSLTASDELYDAILKQGGVIRMESVEDLANSAIAFSHIPLLDGNRIVILTNAGGPGIMAVDAAIRNGLAIEEPPSEVKTQLHAVLPSFSSIRNPIDTTGGIDVDTYLKCLQILDKTDCYDGILALYVRSFSMSVTEFAQKLVSMKEVLKKPLIVCLMGITEVEEAVNLLQENDIVVYTFPEQAVRSFAMLYTFSKISRHYEDGFVSFDVATQKAKDLFNSATVGKEGFISERVALELLKYYGFQVVEGDVVHSVEEAIEMGCSLGFPLVLKIISPSIVHKFDVGGVKLNIRNREELEKEVQDLLERFPEREGILVQKMIQGYEVILGGKREPRFGPVLLFGLGGIYVELFQDISFRLAPLSKEEAIQMVEETKVASLLKGVRGQGPSNKEALIEAILRLSQLLTEQERIEEIDLNPVIVNEEGAFVVDVRIKKSIDS